MSSQEIYIPPEGIYFRLLGYVSQQVIYSRTDREPQVGLHPVSDQFDDQFFTLIHGTGDRKGMYAIRSKVTGQVLFSRTHMSPNVGHTVGDGWHHDNWFIIEPGKNMYAKQFRLITPSVGVALVSRTHVPPYYWNHPTSDFFSDQLFNFAFEDMTIEKIEYDLKLGKIMSSTPKVLANQTLRNDSSQLQEMSFQISESETHTSSYDYTFGFTITMGAKFKAKVPFVGETEFSVGTSIQDEWSWGEQNSFQKTYTATLPVKAGTNETVRAVSTVTQGEIEVPYTIHLTSKSTGTKTESKGVWRGVSTWDLRHTISSVKHE